jgi:DNA-binding CsgD family transcriptional regulator
VLIRLMTSLDLAQCLARWPLPGVSPDLAGPVLQVAFREQRLRGAVIRHLSTGRLLGFGLSGFVPAAHVLATAQSGQSLIAAHLHAESHAQPVYLDPVNLKRVQRAGQLHLVVVTYQQDTVDVHDPLAMELVHAGHTAFRLMHEGFALQGVWQEGLPSDAGWMSAGGFVVKHRTAGSDVQPRWLYGAVREDVSEHWPSHTLSYVLKRRTRRLGLSAAQCRVAELALWQMDDAQVAQHLNISPATVRKHWRGIFDRLDRSDALQQEGDARPVQAAHRGPERRRWVLDYLRSHLQEIRPA